MAAAMRRVIFPQRASDDFGAAASLVPARFAPAAWRLIASTMGKDKKRRAAALAKKTP